VKKIFYILVLMNGCALPGWGQTEAEKEKLRQLEIQRQAEQQRLMRLQLDSAVALMDLGEHEKADQKFLKILKNVKSVPTDLTFYFGKNSFFLNKYKQSVDWLNKYIQLKGMSGQFSQEALLWKMRAEDELLKERAEESKHASEVLAQDYDIDCGPSGKVICPVCNGTTVIIKKGYINDTYKTCGYCQHTGVLSCDDYNKLLRGQLKPGTR
jgi:tetratricopeptide (TPR) repeat protein